MSKPVVFLDFDGVLNHASYDGPKINGCLGLDPTRVKLLTDFVVEMDALIVVSSTWRLFHDITELKSLLIGFGKMPAEVAERVVAYTPLRIPHARMHEGVPRGDEILVWLRDNPQVTNFVILDDDSDMNRVQGWLVQTDFTDGLQSKHIGAARRVLERHSIDADWSHQMMTSVEERNAYER